MSSNGHNDVESVTLAETDSYMIWKANDPDGEVSYHLELNGITIHFLEEDWQEFLSLIQAIG